MTIVPRSTLAGQRPTGSVLAQAPSGDSHEIPSLRRPQGPSEPRIKPPRPDPSHFDAKALSAPPPPKRRKAEPPPAVEGALMTCREVAAMLRVSEKALEHHRRRGTGPAYIHLGGRGRGVRYTRQAVDEYLHRLTNP